MKFTVCVVLLACLCAIGEGYVDRHYLPNLRTGNLPEHMKRDPKYAFDPSFEYTFQQRRKGYEESKDLMNLIDNSIATKRPKRSDDDMNPKDFIWANGMVLYEDQLGNSDLSDILKRAMSLLSAVSTVTFVENYDSNERIYFDHFGREVYSCTIGYFPGDCGFCEFGLYLTLKLALHELLHALGSPHEQNRNDAANNIVLHLECLVDQSLVTNFQTFASFQQRTQYDITSILHYGSHAFGKSDDCKTIKTKKAALEKGLGKTPFLSACDVIDLVNLYKDCLADDRAENGGFYNCATGSSLCNEYFGGTHCLEESYYGHSIVLDVGENIIEIDFDLDPSLLYAYCLIDEELVVNVDETNNCFEREDCLDGSWDIQFGQRACGPYSLCGSFKNAISQRTGDSYMYVAQFAESNVADPGCYLKLSISCE